MSAQGQPASRQRRSRKSSKGCSRHGNVENVTSVLSSSGAGINSHVMRRFVIYALLGCWLTLAWQASAATGRIIKVLPHFLDLKGRHSLSPSLYDRDAYQARLRDHREERSGMRFDIEWKSKGGVFEPL